MPIKDKHRRIIPDQHSLSSQRQVRGYAFPQALKDIFFSTICNILGSPLFSCFLDFSGQNVCVRLEKNSRDLGFSLEGGVDSGLENRPLTVQKIFQGEN